VVNGEGEPTKEEGGVVVVCGREQRPTKKTVKLPGQQQRPSRSLENSLFVWFTCTVQLYKGVGGGLGVLQNQRKKHTLVINQLWQ
jgi:hypothetical protein